MPRPHKYQTTGSRPNTVSNAVDCKCFYHYKWNVDHYAVIEEEERENSIISSSSSSGSISLPDKPDQIDQPDLNDENAQDYLNFEVQKNNNRSGHGKGTKVKFGNFAARGGMVRNKDPKRPRINEDVSLLVLEVEVVEEDIKN